MNIDNNLAAPLQVLLFLGSATLAGILVLVSVYGAFRKKPWVRWTLGGLLLGVLIYGALLFGFSAASREKTLARGQEKYFCEIDCHLAYSIVDVQERPLDNEREFAITLRTRFDESTISPQRPKDAPLVPNPRQVQLVDSSGQAFPAALQEGTSLMQSLVPGQSYTSTILFRVPQSASGLRMLITAPAGPVEVLVGNESSYGHKKTYLAL